MKLNIRPIVICIVLIGDMTYSFIDIRNYLLILTLFLAASTFQICQSYSKLVEKVPSSVLERASGLPQSVEYSQNKCLDEILQRKYKLQQIMKSGESACCHLLTCVEEEGYLEHEDINGL